MWVLSVWVGCWRRGKGRGGRVGALCVWVCERVGCDDAVGVSGGRGAIHCLRGRGLCDDCRVGRRARSCGGEGGGRGGGSLGCSSRGVGRGGHCGLGGHGVSGSVGRGKVGGGSRSTGCRDRRDGYGCGSRRRLPLHVACNTQSGDGKPNPNRTNRQKHNTILFSKAPEPDPEEKQAREERLVGWLVGWEEGLSTVSHR